MRFTCVTVIVKFFTDKIIILTKSVLRGGYKGAIIVLVVELAILRSSIMKSCIKISKRAIKETGYVGKGYHCW